MNKPSIPALGLGGGPSAPAKKKPMIPSLGPNLGKLGFTDLQNDEDEKADEGAAAATQEPKPQEISNVAKKPMMGMGLNLAGVGRSNNEETKQPEPSQ